MFRKKKADNAHVLEKSISKSLDPYQEEHRTESQAESLTPAASPEQECRNKSCTRSGGSSPMTAIWRALTPDQFQSARQRTSSTLADRIRQLHKHFRRTNNRDNIKSGVSSPNVRPLLPRKRSFSLNSVEQLDKNLPRHSVSMATARFGAAGVHLMPPAANMAGKVRTSAENQVNTTTAIRPPSIRVQQHEGEASSQIMDFLHSPDLTSLPRRRSSDTCIGRRRSLSGSCDLDLACRSPKALLYRDEDGSPTVEILSVENVSGSSIEPAMDIYRRLAVRHRCYDMMPNSAKLVFIDTELAAKKAFFALRDNECRAAPLWERNTQQFVGLLTITDFIRILLKLHSRQDSHVLLQHLQNCKIREMRSTLGLLSEMHSVGPDVSIEGAVSALRQYRCHRLPVVDPVSGDVLHMITYKRIIRYLYRFMVDLPVPECLNLPLRNVPVGTFQELATVAERTSLLDTLHKFMSAQVSSLPVVTESGVLIDMISRFDIISLAGSSSYFDLDITVETVLQHRCDPPVETCTEHITLAQLIDLVVEKNLHRVVVVDGGKRVCGVVSLSDIVQFLVLSSSLDDTYTTSDGKNVTRESTPTFLSPA